MTPSSARPGALNSTDTLLLTTVFTGAGGCVTLWAGAATTNAAEVQYNQVGPTGSPHAAAGSPASRVMAKTVASGLILGIG